MIISNMLVDMVSRQTQFDPSIPEHRRIAALYLKDRSWRHTRVRFMVQYPYTNLVTMITTKLALYYTSAEFFQLYEDGIPDMYVPQMSNCDLALHGAVMG